MSDDELPTAVVDDARLVERPMWTSLEVEIIAHDDPPRYGRGRTRAHLLLGDDNRQRGRANYRPEEGGVEVTISTQIDDQDWEVGDPTGIRLVPGLVRNPARKTIDIDVTESVEDALSEPTLAERVDALTDQVDRLWSAVRDLETEVDG